MDNAVVVIKRRNIVVVRALFVEPLVDVGEAVAASLRTFADGLEVIHQFISDVQSGDVGTHHLVGEQRLLAVFLLLLLGAGLAGFNDDLQTELTELLHLINFIGTELGGRLKELLRNNNNVLGHVDLIAMHLLHKNLTILLNVFEVVPLYVLIIAVGVSA